MKKQILNIGKALSRAEQKEVFGGNVLTQEIDGQGSAWCYCNNGGGVSAPDCSWCQNRCGIRDGYKGVCIQW